MADICACNGSSCPMKLTCYRYTCVKNVHWQSYFVESPLDIDGACKYYWPIHEEENKHDI